jgi:hypothetical protein
VRGFNLALCLMEVINECGIINTSTHYTLNTALKKYIHGDTAGLWVRSYPTFDGYRTRNEIVGFNRNEIMQ